MSAIGAFAGGIIGAIVGQPAAGAAIGGAITGGGTTPVSGIPPSLVGMGKNEGTSTANIARHTRVLVYCWGVQHGVIVCAQYLLHLAYQENAPTALVADAQAAVGQLTASYPGVMRQAASLGAIPDSNNDALLALHALLSANIGLSLPLLGTNDGTFRSTDAQQTAAALTALYIQQGGIPAQGGTSSSGAITSIVEGAASTAIAGLETGSSITDSLQAGAEQLTGDLSAPVQTVAPPAGGAAMVVKPVTTVSAWTVGLLIGGGVLVVVLLLMLTGKRH